MKALILICLLLLTQINLAHAGSGGMDAQRVGQILLKQVEHPQDNPRQDAVGFKSTYLQD